ncbi:hypothetical protein [Pseudoalteromonas sp. SK20]|uniref:hypothetical protein n=1 Tax=Pseudoalteromonas sp. SK20 TaxID=1938367 RepID=UPI000975C549|nr:hypothetical protein [Pseudoalteromonas sp. SK20]
MTSTPFLITLVIVNFALRLRLRSAVAPWFLKLIFLLGVPLHEAAHYLAAKCLMIKVIDVKFIPDFKSQKSMGYVNFIPHKGLIGVITNMIVGLAPLLFGAALFYLLYSLTIKLSADFLYTICISIASVILMQSMIPSWQDIKISLNGILLVAVVLFSLNFYGFKISDFFWAYDYAATLNAIEPYLIALTIYQISAVIVLSILLANRNS